MRLSVSLMVMGVTICTACDFSTDPKVASAKLEIECAEATAKILKDDRGDFVRFTLPTVLRNDGEVSIRVSPCVPYLEEMIEGKWSPVWAAACVPESTNAQILDPGESFTFNGSGDFHLSGEDFPGGARPSLSGDFRWHTAFVVVNAPRMLRDRVRSVTSEAFKLSLAQ